MSIVKFCTVALLVFLSINIVLSAADRLVLCHTVWTFKKPLYVSISFKLQAVSDSLERRGKLLCAVGQFQVEFVRGVGIHVLCPKTVSGTLVL